MHLIIFKCGKVTDILACVASSYQHQLKLPSQPKGVDSVSGGLTVVACINEVVLLLLLVPVLL